MSTPLKWVLEFWLDYNPFFIYTNRDPLLHQTEVVAKALLIRPLRIFIADSIGLGKTIEALRILSAVSRYRKLNYVLVAVPSTLVEQWVEELRLSGIRAEVLDRTRLLLLDRLPAVPPGWYVGSVDTLKKGEYGGVLKKVKWDAVVVDEAHRVGVSGLILNQRWRFLKDFMAGAGRDAILLLLSATPHRGKAYDYLLRLSLLDPILLDLTGFSEEIVQVFDKPEFYTHTHNTIFFRRTKEDVNKVYEGRQVFKPCLMHAVVVEPTPEQKEFMKLVDELALNYLSKYYYEWYPSVTLEEEASFKGVVSILKAVLIKRALSSPESAEHTFGKIILKRGLLMELVEKEKLTLDKAREELTRRYEDRLKKVEEEYMSGDVSDAETEAEPDTLFDELTDLYVAFVEGEEAHRKLERLEELSKVIGSNDELDRKLGTLKKIIDLVVFSNPEAVKELPEEYRDLISGKVVVFTEFKDTARYLERKLRKWLKERYGDDRMLKVLTSENKHELEDVVEWLKTSKRAVLIATDVGSEGLNLQYANVLVNYDIAWSPLRLEQRIGRLWRYGQVKTVYVFNLFLAHEFERKVSDVVYEKLYGMTQSIGKIDALLGERVYYSAIQNELLEKAVGEGTRLGGLIPLELDEKHRLTEVTIINMIAEDAKAFVKYFMNALKKLLTQIKKNNIYPQAPDRMSVEEFLSSLTGFKNHEEVEAVVKRVAGTLGVKGFEVAKNPEIALRKILPQLQKLPETRVYIYQSDAKELIALTAGEVKICRGSACEVAYREPLAVLIGEGNTLNILRGSQLAEKLLEISKTSIPVDESSGLDEVLNTVAEVLKNRRTAVEAIYQERRLKKVVEHVKKLKDYESKRLKLAGGEKLTPYFFTDVVASVEGDYAYVFIPTSYLPSVKTLQSGEVWFWLEDLVLKHVERYERACGREPIVVKSAEHYDVRSVGPAEERYIEVKAPVSNKLLVTLTESEFETAKKYGERYWLYIVLGADTDKPAILCVRNPANKLKFVKEERIEKRTRYVLTV